MTQPAIVIVPNIVDINEARYSGLLIAKLSSSSGLSPLLALNKPLTSYSRLTNPGSISESPLILMTASLPVSYTHLRAHET